MLSIYEYSQVKGFCRDLKFPLILFLYMYPADEETLLMARIEELRYHIRVESAVQEGAEKAIKLLKNFKSVDKKPLQEVQFIMLCMYCARASFV